MALLSLFLYLCAQDMDEKWYTRSGMKEGLMYMRLDMDRLSRLLGWLSLQWRNFRLGNSVAHHDERALCAAYRGELREMLNHLECQADYLTRKISLRFGSLGCSMEDREELAYLLDLIEQMEPRDDPEFEDYNEKLAALKARYGRLTRPTEPLYGIR